MFVKTLVCLIPEDKIKPVISSIEMEKTCHRTVIFEGKRDQTWKSPMAPTFFRFLKVQVSPATTAGYSATAAVAAETLAGKIY